MNIAQLEKATTAAFRIASLKVLRERWQAAKQPKAEVPAAVAVAAAELHQANGEFIKAEIDTAERKFAEL